MDSLADFAGCVATAFVFTGACSLLPSERNEHDEVDQYAQQVCTRIKSASQSHPHGIKPIKDVAFKVDGRKYICKL
jgi:hypothetical protein